jgi:hypothetical protein
MILMSQCQSFSIKSHGDSGGYSSVGFRIDTDVSAVLVIFDFGKENNIALIQDGA